MQLLRIASQTSSYTSFQKHRQRNTNPEEAMDIIRLGVQPIQLTPPTYPSYLKC